MAERVSALHNFGGHDGGGVSVREVTDLRLHQIAAWHDTLINVGERAAAAGGVTTAPSAGSAAVSTTAVGDAALLRVEPLKWWLINADPPPLAAADGTTLDLSHSRAHLRVTGEHAVTLLNRHLPLDLREKSFPADSVASTALHHVGVTVWRSRDGYELFIPRGFALSVFEVLLQTAAQFGDG